ncbi:MAG: D-alanyl-D-alanine carboxypeptidase, partial [Paraburkholderia hospita]
MPLAFVSLASSYARSLGRRFRTLTSAHADPAAALPKTGRAAKPSPFSHSHRRAAARAAAVLFACAALAVAAPADARKKAQQPAVNVTTVLPPAVMAGLQRAHVPLSSISVVVEKVGDRTPVLAL